jgi:hypothetical protein
MLCVVIFNRPVTIEIIDVAGEDGAEVGVTSVSTTLPFPFSCVDDNTKLSNSS